MKKETKDTKKARRYNNKDITKLLVACGGRCTLCNKDVMSDFMTFTQMDLFEKAHIVAFSDFGPRANPSLSIAERNDIDNLMILCPICHDTIDKEIVEGSYTVEWLKKTKKAKEDLVNRALNSLNLQPSVIVKYFSVIGTAGATIDDNSAYKLAFENGLCSTEHLINLSEDADSEDIKLSRQLLDRKFEARIKRQIDNLEEKRIVLFARAPQPLLIYLGTLFNDKHQVEIFTSLRNNRWVYDEKVDNQNTFNIVEPKKIIQDNNIALKVSSTAEVADERVYNVLGDNTDIWEIKANNIGVDNISSQAELLDFYKQCVTILDRIGVVYGKEKHINLFCAMCNSLAITFGRAIFQKAHNKINIYDSIRDGEKIQDVLRLTI
ncbi:TPA: SAVED domain-containing protein [Candidatus Scatousia excrementigallinarum]|uniref:SAVED domain-containing protein n=1 Tax=Candidatus Scatousia excrementigallinarum TaxID=2840935 RepID=A0A9D1F1G0_9BACT|nr:SAVED domain-containing protein [Candidatus Scatousia excrementigallinarum]